MSSDAGQMPAALLFLIATVGLAWDEAITDSGDLTAA
jgi:hypothetical protein